MVLRKKLISLMLCLVMILVLVPAPVSAATVGGGCGDNLTWELDDAGTLTISGTGAMAEYVLSSEVPWNEYLGQIKQVRIPAGLTVINSVGASSWGRVPVWVDAANQSYSSDSYGVLFNKNKTVLISAPWGMSGTYTVPNTVEELAEGAFWSSDLSEIILPDSLEIIGERAFSSCHNLYEIVVPRRVYSIGVGAFSTGYIYGYIWVDEDNLNFSNDSYGVLFNKDKTILLQAPSGLTGSYTVPDTVRIIDKEAFAGVLFLTEIIIPESVTRIEECAFFLAMRLEVIRGGKNVKYIGRAAFSNCQELSDIYYDGTMNQALRIYVEPDNESFLNATFHFQPAISGDMDGDGDKDTDDAVYLLLNVMFGDEDYPLAQ